MGCRDTALVTIIKSYVAAYAGPDGIAELNIPYQLTGSGGINYQWSPASPLNNPFIPDPLATLSSDTTFVLTVEDNLGCKATDSVKIRVLKGPSIYVPNSFSPNGDGRNDTFGPITIGIVQLDYFRVFNRYGEIVFETAQVGKMWDGSFKGSKSDVGTYVWMVRGTDRTGVARELKGYVVLIR